MNEDTLTGKLKSVGGKIKQSAGEAFGDQELANSGAADQVKGAGQETWGNVKDAAHDLGHTSRVETTEAREDTAVHAHNARTGIANAAEHVKDAISHGIDHLRGDLREEREEHREREYTKVP